MKTLLLLVLSLLLRPWHAHAQQPAAAIDSLLKVNVEHSGRYTNTFYTINGEPITDGTLKKLLAKYPESAAELHKFKKQRRTALLLLPVYVASMTVGLVQTYPERTEPGSLFSKAPVPFSIALSAFFGSIVVLATNDHYGKAIEAYNAHFHAQQAAR